jgi:hypothetical protein
MAIYSLLAFIFIVLSRDRGLADFQLLLLPVSYFFASHLMTLRRRGFAELQLFLAFAASFSAAYFLVVHRAELPRGYSLNSMLVSGRNTTDAKGNVGGKILVFGDDYSWYWNRHLSGPYLNWQLSREEISHFESYDNSLSIYHNFKSEWPETIISYHKEVDSLFAKMPIIAKRYNVSTPHHAPYKVYTRIY